MPSGSWDRIRTVSSHLTYLITDGVYRVLERYKLPVLLTGCVYVHSKQGQAVGLYNTDGCVFCEARTEYLYSYVIHEAQLQSSKPHKAYLGSRPVSDCHC